MDIEPFTQPVTVDDLTPRELAVASMVARSWTTKQIAAALEITDRRVLCLLSAVARKSGCEPGREDKVHVALWYRAQVPLSIDTIPIQNLPAFRRAS